MGKSNKERLISYINQDTFEANINEIDLEQLEHDVMSNRFDMANPQTLYEPLGKAEKSQVGMSQAGTLEHIINMKLKAMRGLQQAPAMQQQTIQTPAVPPPFEASRFSFYIYLEEKQQDPYDEKQFAAFVQ